MKTFSKTVLEENRNYLELLSDKFPDIQKTTAEIINLNAILNLPKGTEHFLSDIHGEYAAFEHVLRNCSGSIKRKVEETLEKKLSEKEMRELTTIIYYPSEKLHMLKNEGILDDKWIKKTILSLIDVCRVSASKYSHSKIRKSFPENYAYIIQELLFENDVNGNRHSYYDQIIDSIIETDASEDFIINICATIRKLNLDHLHIIGDIYDRGSSPDKVMNTLMKQHSVDIQWGNHDILWIGAAAGNKACVANVVRICLRYGNTAILEQGYGINLLPLSIFAMNTYGDDPNLKLFMPRLSDEVPDIDDDLLSKMQKAISIIQFKLEDEIIKNHPTYSMDDRRQIKNIDFCDYSLDINNKKYLLNSSFFPTINKSNPCKLTSEEEKIIDSLTASFHASEKLAKHISYMLSSGSTYKVYNNNLLFHAHVPVNEDLSFRNVNIDGNLLNGKNLMDKIDEMVRAAYFDEETGSDILWYLWCAPDSPIFGKDKMATFERYFIDDPATHKESYSPFYHHLENSDMAIKILKEFDCDTSEGRIICGHVPVKAIKGESPIKAEGKLICIDGGFSKAYHSETGMAGCTLTFNSYGMNLIIHEPFDSVEKAIREGIDIKSETRFVSSNASRLLVSDTDTGKELKKQIYYLEMLLYAYKSGELKIKSKKK